MKPAVEIFNLSKSYNISHQNQAQYKSLRDDLAALFTRPISLITGRSTETEQFWALKDVSFKVEAGEVVGIIGRNGSGKSTLLKILSRITEPSGGEAILRGRVASLLEVGTGFHPELTGRENIYFNGSILGMTKKEINAKFNEIVDFAEIEKFLDTPVKFYSSGMYVRLAFAIAAHLEPDILIVDEVLAVGDAAFQKKSLGKMRTVAGDGRTVIFVSHSMDTVKQLCTRAVLLENGQVKAVGDTRTVAKQYLGDTNETKPVVEFDNGRTKGDAYFELIKLLSSDGKPSNHFSASETWSVEINYRIKERLRNSFVAVEIQNDQSETIYMTTDTDTLPEVPDKKPGQYTARMVLDAVHLTPGDYSLRISLQAPGVKLYDMVEALPFSVEPASGDIRATFFGGRYYGYISNKAEWSTQPTKK